MSRTPLVLAIAEDSAHVEAIRQALVNGRQPCTVQPVERVRTALARIAGGGVDAVLLDLSSCGKAGSDALESLLKLHAGAPDVPIVALCDAADDALALEAVQAGAFASLPSNRWSAELSQTVQRAIEQRQPDSGHREKAYARPAGTIIAMVGAKGGAGTTSVSLNAASSLARASRVVVAELRPPFGSLAQYLRPQARVRTAGHLAEMPAEAISQADVEACLWPARNIPGLSVLFAPQTIGRSSEIGPEHAMAIIKHLGAMADFVLLDLPACLSETNRALFRASDLLSLVVERDVLCVEAAKVMLQAIDASGCAPQRIGSIVVNRAPLASPMPLTEIENQLGIPTLAVIPPAADLCASAQRARIPVVSFDPESLMAGSLVNLAGELSRLNSATIAFQPALR